MTTMHRPMPDFADALERHLREAAAELARSVEGGAPARPRFRAPRLLRRPLAAAGSFAVVVAVVVAVLLFSGSGGNTQQAFGGPRLLQTPLVTLPEYARPGGAAAFVLGPGSERIRKGHRFVTKGGYGYLYGNAAGWCLTVPDPLSSQPEVERGVSCVRMEDFERDGIAVSLSDDRTATYVAAIPRGVRSPELVVRGRRPQALVPSDVGIVTFRVDDPSTVTRFDREGGRREDPVLSPPPPPDQDRVVPGTPMPYIPPASRAPAP